MNQAGYELVRRMNRGMQSPWVLGLWEENNESSVTPSIVWQEVLMVLCNRNAIAKLYLWADQVIRAGVRNWIVVCLDQHTADTVSQKYGIEHVDARVHFAQEKSNSHSISALKYQVAVQYLKRNCAVLLSDVDVIVHAPVRVREQLEHVPESAAQRPGAPRLLSTVSLSSFCALWRLLFYIR